jgi:hypothetical protein
MTTLKKKLMIYSTWPVRITSCHKFYLYIFCQIHMLFEPCIYNYVIVYKIRIDFELNWIKPIWFAQYISK